LKWNKNKLSIIIVNYNGGEYILKTLESIEKHPPSLPFEIIVVDNASTDGSCEKVAKSFPSVHLLRLEENIGFGRANNLGVENSSGDLILFLNNDTYVTEDALDSMAEFLKNPKVGAVGCKLLYGNGKFQLSFGKDKSFFREIKDKFLGRLLEKFYAFRLRGKKTSFEVDWLCGACIMTRRDVIKTVGGFDETFFLYMEDVDWCKRVREAGYRVLYTTEAEIFHFVGKSVEKEKKRVNWESKKSRILFYRKHRLRWEISLLKVYYKFLALFNREYRKLESFFRNS